MSSYKKFIFLVVFFCFNYLEAQNIFCDKLDKYNGLPTSTIYDIFQDKNGFIWLATEEGLLKYNGQYFKSYHHTNLHSKAGSRIKEDNLGRIWYQTFDGFLFFVDNNDQLNTFIQKENLGFVNYHFTDKHLIKPTQKGILFYNLKNFKIEKQISFKDFQYTFSEIIDNELLFYNKKAQIYNLNSNQFYDFKNLEIQNGHQVFSTYWNNRLYIISQKLNFDCSVFVYQNKNLLKITSFNPNQKIQNFDIIDNKIWVCTKKGVFSYDFKGHKIEHNLHLNIDISKIYKDKNNVYWLSTLSNGIYLIKDFETKEILIPNEKLNTLSIDKNNVYVGTATGKIFTINNQLNPSFYYKFVNNYPIYYLNFDANQNYFFASSNGFYAINKTDKKQFFTNPGAVKDLLKVDESKYYVTGTGFFTEFNLTNNLSWNENNFIDGIRGKSIAQNNTKTHTYIATNNGLFCYSEGKNWEIKYQNRSLFLKNLIAYKNGILALSNQGNVYFIHHNQVKQIALKKQFNLLKKIDTTVYLIEANKVFLFENETLKPEFSLGNQIKIINLEKQNQYFYALTEDKVIRIKENSTKISFEKPKLFIENIWINNKTKPLNEQKLNHKENDIQINFDLLNLDFDNDYELFYTINGVKKSIPKLSNNIRLVSLSPNSYHIKFGITNTNTNTYTFFKQNIKFEILQPFYRRFWFISIGVIVFITLFYWYYKNQIAKVKAKKQLEIETLKIENNLKESRLQLIKSQMNPHFFFNAINNIQSYIFTNETKEAAIYLSKFSKLTRKILEFSDVDSISLKDEIASLQLYLELQQMRFKDLKFEIKHDSILNLESIKIPTMLFQPYVENAILHGLSHSNKDKKLEIKFEWEASNLLTATIWDNGIGRIKSAELNQLNTSKPKSFATKANLERIMLLNKDQYQIEVNYEDLYDENSESQGTKVTIKIKL